MSGQTKKFVKVDCGSCPIRKRAVCSRSSDTELEQIEKMKSYRTYEAGQTIVWAGDDMKFIGSVVTGVASISKTMEDGRRQMVGLLLPSDFVGRPGRLVAPYDIAAITEVVLCRFQKNQFEQLIDTSPSVGPRLLEMTMDELDAAREWMLLLGRKTAREKIASLLSIFAHRDKHLKLSTTSNSAEFELPLTREAMAEYLGLTIETASRQMSALKREGVIALQGKRNIKVPDLARLLNESGDDADGGILI